MKTSTSHLFGQALKTIESARVLDADLGDVFNEVIRSFSRLARFILSKLTARKWRRRKLANFMAHAHHLEKRVAQSFAYHMDACGAEAETCHCADDFGDQD